MIRATRAAIVAICLIAGLVATASPALAATILVDSGAIDDIIEDDSCSLREAVTIANGDPAGGDCGSPSPGPDTIRLPGDLPIDVRLLGSPPLFVEEELVIQGVGSSETLIDISSHLDTAFDIALGVEVTFMDLTIDGGGINPHEAIVNAGDLTLDSVALTGNVNSSDGGAVFSTGDLTVRDARFADNASDYGGALYLDGGTVLIEDSVFSDNGAGLDGGAIYITGADLTIRGTEFSDNQAQDPAAGGGAIFADCTCTGASLAIEDSTFNRNEASQGGALFVWGRATIAESYFFENSADDEGGAVYALDAFPGPLAISDSSFESNGAASGGAVFAWLSLVTVDGSTIFDNRGELGGGGLLVETGSLEVVNSTVSTNRGTLGIGGGIAAIDSDVYLLHATVTGNDASGPGAGGGLFTTDPDLISAEGSIIAGNPTGGDCSGLVEDVATNLDSDGTCFDGSGGSITAPDPLLGPLDDHGGPTPTHPLLGGSPALDVGDPASCAAAGNVDQRGETRPSGGGCDLGAFELYVPPPPPKPRHTLSVSRTSGGTVTSANLNIECGTRCSASLTEGTTGVLTAVADDGREFVGWEGDCASVDDNECTVSMAEDRNVVATFSGIEPPPDPVIAKGRCEGMEHGSLRILEDGTLMVAGTEGDDVLSGSDGPDVICGLGGDDILRGRRGADILLGGAGNDKLFGGKGPDRLNGGSGQDSCIPGKGKDKLIACE